MKRLLLATLMLATTLNAVGQAYPTKPTRIVVGFPPGGTIDVLGRVIATKLTESWQQTVIVENRVGANGVIATELVAKSPADGYMLLIAGQGQMVINRLMDQKLPYDTVRDFAPVTSLATFPLILSVQSSEAANSVKELLVTLTKKSGQLNYGSSAMFFRLTTEMFKQMASVDMKHIPYKGSAQVVTALIAGDIQVAFLDPAPVLPLIRAGKVKALATTSPVRNPFYPGIPTVIESGLPGFEAVAWNALFAPSLTPREVIAKLHQEINRVLLLPEVGKILTGLDVVPTGSTPEALAAQVKNDISRYAAVMKAANITAESN